MVGDVNMRIVLFSEVNSKFGAPILTRLLDYPGIDLVGLVTSPDGRLCDYYVDEPDPVDLAELARAAEVAVFRPMEVNRLTLVEQLRRLNPDFFAIGNYQQILRQWLLDIPANGTVNFHPSPLPRYAGLAPFFWMAKHGEHEGGVSAVWTTTEIDGGPLLAQRPVVLSGTETAGRIRDLHFHASWQLLDEVLPDLIDQTYTLTPQDARQRTYFGRPNNEDYLLDWSAQTTTVLQTIRASLPGPGALTVAESGRPLRIAAARPEKARRSRAARPGEVQRGEHGEAIVRTGDGWVSVDAVVLGSAPGGARVRVADLPALPTTFRVFAEFDSRHKIGA